MISYIFFSFKISTSLYLNELRGHNYAGLIEKSDENAFILITFVSNIDRDLKFRIDVIDSSNTLIRSKKFEIPKGQHDFEIYALIENLLPVNTSSYVRHGLWRANVVGEFEMTSNKINERLLIVYYFYVQPTNERDLDLYLLKQLWPLKATCIREREEIHDDDSLIQCERDADWSSYYPDPKSDFRFGFKNGPRI